MKQESKFATLLKPWEPATVVYCTAWFLINLMTFEDSLIVFSPHEWEVGQVYDHDTHPDGHYWYDSACSVEDPPIQLIVYNEHISKQKKRNGQSLDILPGSRSAT